MPHETVNIHLSNDEQLQVVPKNQRRIPMNFCPVGVLNTKDANSMDAISVLNTLTKTESAALEELRTNMNTSDRASDNKSSIIMDGLDTSAKYKLKRGIAGLIKKDLIIRTKKTKYLINPWLIGTMNADTYREWLSYK